MEILLGPFVLLLPKIVDFLLLEYLICTVFILLLFYFSDHVKLGNFGSGWSNSNNKSCWFNNSANYSIILKFRVYLSQCYIFQNKTIRGRERVIGENTSSYSFNGYLTLMFVGPSWSWSYGSWIYNYWCNQCLSPLTLLVGISIRRGVLDITLCDKVCQWLAAGWLFSPGTTVSPANKTDHHDIAEILLEVA